MTNHSDQSRTRSAAQDHGLVNRRYSASYAKRYGHIGQIYQKRYFAKEVDSLLGLLTVSSYIHRNPIETKQPMVERLELYPYSSFPLYWDDSLPAPAFLDQELLRGLLSEPFEKNNTAYCMYCLTYLQNAEVDKYVENMEPPVMQVVECSEDGNSQKSPDGPRVRHN